MREAEFWQHSQLHSAVPPPGGPRLVRSGPMALFTNRGVGSWWRSGGLMHRPRDLLRRATLRIRDPHAHGPDHNRHEDSDETRSHISAAGARCTGSRRATSRYRRALESVRLDDTADSSSARTDGIPL
jgi:hypothetical protein